MRSLSLATQALMKRDFVPGDQVGTRTELRISARHNGAVVDTVIDSDMRQHQSWIEGARLWSLLRSSDQPAVGVSPKGEETSYGSGIAALDDLLSGKRKRRESAALQRAG